VNDITKSLPGFAMFLDDIVVCGSIAEKQQQIHTTLFKRREERSDDCVLTNVDLPNRRLHI